MLDVAPPPAVLKQNMTVSVDIEVARRPQALIVPLSAGHDTDVQVPLQRLKSIDRWQAVARQSRAMPGVMVVSPLAGGSVLVVRGVASRAITVSGIEPALVYRNVTLPDKIVQGKAELTGGDLLIGTELAADSGLGVSDKLRLTTASSTAEKAHTTLTIAGILELGHQGADKHDVFVALQTAQSLLALPPAQNSVTNAIRFFVGLSVAFGSASVLAVVVVQKSREIGILTPHSHQRAALHAWTRLWRSVAGVVAHPTAFTALQNVMMPMLGAQEFPTAAMRTRAETLIAGGSARSRTMGAATNRGEVQLALDCFMSRPNASAGSSRRALLGARDPNPSMLGALRRVVSQVLPLVGRRSSPQSTGVASDETAMHSPCL